jgi:hypothetical protein
VLSLPVLRSVPSEEPGTEGVKDTAKGGTG